MNMRKSFKGLATPTRLGVGGAVLLAMGMAGGAGAVSLSRPTVVMAPTVTTPVAKLGSSSGNVVMVKGRVAEVYGNRFVVQDRSGRTMVDAGRGASSIARGQPIMVQGRFDDGQLRAAYLVGAGGTVTAVGPDGAPGRGPHGPGHDGPPPPPPPAGGPLAVGPGGPPPPPPPRGCDLHTSPQSDVEARPAPGVTLSPSSQN